MFYFVCLLHSGNLLCFELSLSSNVCIDDPPRRETLVCGDLDAGQLTTQVVADRLLVSSVARLMENLLLFSSKHFISDWNEGSEASGFLTCLQSNLSLCLNLKLCVIYFISSLVMLQKNQIPAESLFCAAEFIRRHSL